jgi:hypothetical protein
VNETLCTAPTCHTPVHGTYLCGDCVKVLKTDLGVALWLWDELEVTQTRQARIGKDRVGGKSSDTPLPWHESASRARDMLHNTVFTWATAVDRVADRHIEPSRVKPTLEWLISEVTAVGRLENAGRIARAFEGVTQHCLKVIDHPVDMMFAGRCTLDKNDEDGCDADLFAPLKAATVDCWQCGDQWDMESRRAQMLAMAMDWVDTAAKLEKLFLMVGHKIPAGTIRYWASEGRLLPVSILAGDQPTYAVRAVLKLKYGETAVIELAQAC